jgi:prevent-host-death family protein
MTIGYNEADGKLSELLDRVETGEVITITRNGHPIAKLISTGPQADNDLARRIEEFRALRKKGPRVSLEELMEWKNEGRR